MGGGSGGAPGDCLDHVTVFVQGRLSALGCHAKLVVQGWIWTDCASRAVLRAAPLAAPPAGHLICETHPN